MVNPIFKFPGPQLLFLALFKIISIQNSSRVTHTALIDCDLLAKVYINLIDQKEPTLNFQNFEHENLKSKNTNLDYFKKIVRPTSEELKKHEEYLKKNLKNNYFN